MPVYNQQPRPRVLFEALPSDLAQELAALVPTARIVDEGEEVPDAEYDLVVTCAEDAGQRRAHMHVLSFGAHFLDRLPPPEEYPAFGYFYPDRSVRTLATEASIPSAVDPEVRALLERTVMANMPPGEKFAWKVTGRAEATALIELGHEGLMYAMLWLRPTKDKSGISVVLPPETTDHRAWLVWFLRWLHKTDSETFPGSPDWSVARDWATFNTLELHDELTALQADRARLLASLEGKEREINSRLEDARAADKIGYQRLLTADGDELEAAVQDVLRELGFSVQNMDDHHDAVTKAKLEDLRVTDAEDPEWVALVEIKGYTKGARTNDVGQVLGRPMRAYIIEASREPSCVWHVVNPERGVDPSTRNDAIPNDLDLEGLTDANGALIETRQLFVALRDVQSGKVDAAAVRLSLKNARTRWDYRKVDTASE